MFSVGRSRPGGGRESCKKLNVFRWAEVCSARRTAKPNSLRGLWEAAGNGLRDLYVQKVRKPGGGKRRGDFRLDHGSIGLMQVIYSCQGFW